MPVALRVASGLVLLAALAVLWPAAAGQPAGAGGLTLTVLHTNDTRSRIVNAGPDLEDFGGAARTATLIAAMREQALEGEGDRGILTLSAGNTILAGPQLDASLLHGVPFYDALAVLAAGYDAMLLGNTEFDFGPDVLAAFLAGFEDRLPVLAANLDFNAEPVLQAFVDQGVITPRLVVDVSGWTVGLVGVVTPDLSYISSPRGVIVLPDLATAVQAQVDLLHEEGANIVLLLTQFGTLQEDTALAGQLTGVDAIVAGADAVLANESDLLVPGDERDPTLPYPLLVQDAKGNDLPLVTTAGLSKYVGRLVLQFDAAGTLTGTAGSGPVRVAGGANPDAVEADPLVQETVVEPVAAHVQQLAASHVGTTEAPLDGSYPTVRIEETNEGNLLVDALLWQATLSAAEYGLDPPDVALLNAGAIRNGNVIPPGPVSELDTFSMAPFANFVTIVEDVPAAQIRELLENAVSQVEVFHGRFAHVAGLEVVYDISGDPRLVDAGGNVIQEGTRIQSIRLDDGTPLVTDGAVVEGAPSVSVATISFLAQGGDQYPFGGAEFTLLGVTHQQAIRDYITEALGGVVTAKAYPEGGEGRITRFQSGDLYEGWTPVTYWGPEIPKQGIDAALAAAVTPGDAWLGVARFIEGTGWIQHFRAAPLAAFNTVGGLESFAGYWFFTDQDAVLNTLPLQ